MRRQKTGSDRRRDRRDTWDRWKKIYMEEPESSAAVVKMSKSRDKRSETRRLGPRAREKRAATISINSCALAEAGTHCGTARQVSSTGA